MIGWICGHAERDRKSFSNRKLRTGPTETHGPYNCNYNTNTQSSSGSPVRHWLEGLLNNVRQKKKKKKVMKVQADLFSWVTASWAHRKAASQFRSCILRRSIWRTVTSQWQCEDCLSSKAPSHAAFCYLFLEDAPLQAFAASHIPGFHECPKKKKKRRKWRPQVAQISHLNVRVGFILGFYSFENPIPDMLNFKVKYVGNAQFDAFGRKALKIFTFKR